MEPHEGYRTTNVGFTGSELNRIWLLLLYPICWIYKEKSKSSLSSGSSHLFLWVCPHSPGLWRAVPGYYSRLLSCDPCPGKSCVQSLGFRTLHVFEARGIYKLQVQSESSACRIDGSDPETVIGLLPPLAGITWVLMSLPMSHEHETVKQPNWDL